MENDQTYSISELAERAEVTARTIRYYTAEGLLPPPETQGKYARYTDEHLERLQLIARLKNAYLPLHEIRNRLETLDAEGVRALLRESPQPSRIAETSSAADYITAVMAQQQMPPAPRQPANMVTMQAPAPAPAPAPAAATPTRSGFFRRFSPAPRAEAESAEPFAETWQRITLAPGVELHVQNPQPPAVQNRIEALIAQARALFSGEDNT